MSVSLYLHCEVSEFIWGEYGNQSPEASSPCIKIENPMGLHYVCSLNYTKSSVLLSIICLAMHKIKYLGLDVSLCAFILTFNENVFLHTGKYILLSVC